MAPEEFALRIFGDPVLRRRAEEIKEFTPELQAISTRMFEVMYEEEGVGLAGPQVGLSRRIAVLDVPLDEGNRFVGTLVNPRILRHEGIQKGQEGCLSVPGLREEVARHQKLLVEAEDVEGVTIRFECTDLLARAVQHELDHLDGILYVDRLSPVRRKLLGRKLKRIAETQTEARA
jgi:peptide deformylase